MIDPTAGMRDERSGPSERRYHALTEAIPFISWATDEVGGIVHVNSRWTAYTGGDATPGTSVAEDPSVHPLDAASLATRWAAAAADESVFEAEVRLRRHDGEYHWFSLYAVPSHDENGRLIGWVGTGADVDDPPRDDRDDRNLRFLAEAGALLAASLPYEETICQVADLAVPRVADWCAVDLLDADGQLRSLAIAHAEPGRVSFVRRLMEEYPNDSEHPTARFEVVRSGTPLLVPDIPPEAIRAFARDERHAEMLRELELRSYMCVPLRGGDRILGALTLASSTSERRFGPEDLRVAEALAARLSAAIETAHRYREAERFRLILDSVVEAILVFDPATRVIEEVNRGASELFGRPREQLLGVTMDRLLKPPEAARLAGLVGPLARGERDVETVRIEFQLAKGRTTTGEVVLQPVDLPDGRRGIVAIAHDIRDRIEVQVRLQRLAQAEHARAAELNAVIRAMGEGVVVCGADGTITLANPAGERLFSDVEERTYADILAQLDDPEGAAPALGALGGPVQLPTRADRDRWLELSTYPVNMGVGLATTGEETIVVMRDVTEARRREAVRETFIGVLSHELRTPVTTIYGGAKLLAREGSTLDEEMKRTIFQDIHEEAERLQRLVEDVVALNRFAEDAGDIGREPVLVQRLLPRVVASEESRWPGVTFALDIAAALPTVTADPTYVEQVIRNLISNAAKYGGVGSTVTVAAEAVKREVLVRVLDDGPGFPVEETSRLFELFYRSPGTARSATGAGIGLFVSARLIGAMGGRIWAAPREGGGAEFGIALTALDE
jgi:PAS domain S-box-containing protein